MSLSRLARAAALCALPVFVSACSDDGGGGGDGADAAPDDSDLTHSGTVILFETRYDGFDSLQSGMLFELLFQADENVVDPSYEEAPGSPFGCKAWEFTAEEFQDPGTNAGTLELSIDSGPEIPPCTYDPMEGYQCVGATGSGGDIAPVPEAMNPDGDLFMLTDTEVTFGTDEVGRFVDITGASTATNNGRFPIVDAMGENTIVFVNPNGAEETQTAAEYDTLAGMGPAGVHEDPYPDTGNLSASLAADGPEDLGEFDVSVGLGDAFTLDTATQAVISDIPTDGSAFTLSCDGEGGDCGAALATAVNIQTTDADVTGLPPYVLPEAENTVVRVTCIFLTSRVEVPAEASQYLADSGATRIRAIFSRANNTQAVTSNIQSEVVAGHGVAGFTDVGSQ